MSTLPLRWFQEEANTRTIEAWENGKQAVIVSAPTGAGKTIIFAALLERLLTGTNKRGGVLVHRDTLLGQTIEKMNVVWPGVSTGIIKGPLREYDKQVTVASIDTLSGRIDEYIESLATHGMLDYLIIDECHHSYASTWRSVIDALKEQGTKILGVTATPIRTKPTESLAEIFEDCVFSISIFQLIQEGFLSKMLGYSIKTSLDLDNVRTTQGDFNNKDLSAQVESSDFNLDVIKGWNEKAKNRKSLCFAINIDHVNELTKLFNAAGARAIGIHGELPLHEQRRIISGMAAGEYDVLVNCNLLTEGYDDPSIDCVLMARPTMSRTLYIQMIGRGLRLFPGKEDCLLLDFTSNARDNSLVTMQDLLGFYGMKKAEEIHKKRILASELAGEDKETTLILTPETIGGLNTIDKIGHELGSSVAFDHVDVFDLNKFAWTTLDGDRYVTARDNLAISIRKEGERYTPYLVFSQKDDRCVAQICEPLEFEFALAVANTYLFDYGDRSFVDSNKKWRSENPTPSQASTLTTAVTNYRNRKKHSTIDFKSIEATKGAYSDYLTAIYSAAYIESTKIQRIDRETALEKLKRMVLTKLMKGNRTDGHLEVAVDANSIHLNVSGDYTETEYGAMVDLVVSLINDKKNGQYPAKFLQENKIVFESDLVKVHSTYPLTEKQRGYLNSIIGQQMFRLYFRTKRFVLIAERRETVPRLEASTS